MGARIRRKIAESKSEQRIKEFVIGKLTEVHQALKDVGMYYDGATSQLVQQQGATMTLQAGIIEWMDQHLGKPGFVPSDQIKAICEANIAKAKLAREAREAEAKKRAEEKAELAVVPPESCPTCGSLSPEKCNNPCTDPPASAYRSIDDPVLYETPADIAPASPADAAPADSPGSA